MADPTPHRRTDERGSDEASIAVACAVCGRVRTDGDQPWSVEVGLRGAQQVCTACTRANLRSIEGRLDREWW